MSLFLPQLLRNVLFVFLVFSGAVFLSITSLLVPPVTQAGEIPKINRYIQNGGYGLSRNGQVLFSKNLQKRFIPASTIKLVTSLAALEILGPDYRFSTSLFLDKNTNLHILGSGDPFLVSEKVNTIAQLIREQGITEIQDILLDDSAFSLEGPTEGSENSTNPYDAQCTALGVNFNTIPLKVIHKAKVQSPEPQTPYLPLMGQIGKELPSGYHRANIEAFPPQEHLSNTLLYCGQLFKTLMQRNGIKVKGIIKHGQVPQDTPPLLKYTANETVRDLVQSCLLSSSNFMANQLYLAVGAKQYGFPATWEKAQKAMKNFIDTTLGLSPQQIKMVEGSGLSTNNHITPEAMLLVLEKFRPYASLMPEKYGVLMKSGTLKNSGVFCYAGYIPKGNSTSPFVILLNQKKNSRDKILTILYQQ
ncbi:MAG: D-alanyl-D-alanine carboxypeptidase [Desulfocapsa sp.]|nr:D-alanyl-D-alanine carboxypeptidase [Desulfocapsa sp.]